jgi:hypothetical protein
LLDFGEFRDGFGQAGEDELRGGRGAFGGDGAVFQVLPFFELGVHVLDDEGVFFGGVEGGVEGGHGCVDYVSCYLDWKWFLCCVVLS